MKQPTLTLASISPYTRPRIQTGFNLVLCYYALGDADKMKRGFAKLLSIPIPGMGDEEEEPEEAKQAVS